MLRSMLPLLVAMLTTAGCAVQADADCTSANAAASFCDGAVLVATCGGQEVRQACDDSACPGRRALGCRLDQNDKAFCECGCTSADDVCLGDGILRVCFGGELVDQECTAKVCAEAGLGAPAGCGLAQDGRVSCLCAPK